MLTPADIVKARQLEKVDRALTPAEQALLTEYQGLSADIQQRIVEQEVYVDPKTGEKRVAAVTYTPSTPTVRPKPPAMPTNYKPYLAGAFVLICGFLGYRLSKAKR